MYKYDHKKIEEKWQSRWRESNAFVVKDGVEGAAKAGKNSFSAPGDGDWALVIE